MADWISSITRYKTASAMSFDSERRRVTRSGRRRKSGTKSISRPRGRGKPAAEQVVVVAERDDDVILAPHRQVGRAGNQAAVIAVRAGVGHRDVRESRDGRNSVVVVDGERGQSVGNRRAR